MKKSTSFNLLGKRILVFGLIVHFFWDAFWIERREGSTLRAKALLIQEYSKRMLRVLGVEVDAKKFAEKNLSGLIVCNHLSYVDMLVLSSQFPALYITSIETQESGWVGSICNLAGCLFVERRSRDNRAREMQQIEAVLATGIPVVLFPEATSSDGSKVLPFRPALYECAINANVPVHNFSLVYDNRLVPYYGDMEILPHLKGLTAHSGPIQATLSFLGTILPGPGDCKKSLAESSFQLIRESHATAGTG